MHSHYRHKNGFQLQMLLGLSQNQDAMVVKMSKKESLKIFEDSIIRSLWDDETEQWYFSIVDVVAVLTGSPNPRKYWSVLKTRLKKEGSELATNCSQLKI